MSTGQSTSRVGDSASNPAENSSNFVQAVASKDETSISSFVTRANSQVEAAISHFYSRFSGIDASEKDYAGLTAQIKNLISLTFTGEADIRTTTALPVYVQVPDYIVNRLTERDLADDELIYKIQAMRDFASHNEPSFERNYGQVATSFIDIVEAAYTTLQARQLGTSTTPVCTPVSKANTSAGSDFERLYDAVKYAGNTPVTISSDCVFFEMLTNPEDLGRFIENISGWFAMWSDSTEKWAGSVKTSAGDYSVIMEFLGRMVIATADHDAKEDEMERLRAEKDALVTESKWLAKTLDKTRENLEALKAGVNTITELQAEVDRLRSRYESSTDSQKGGAAK